VGFVFLAFILFIASNLSIWIYTFLKNTVAGTPALRQLRIQTIEEAAPTVIVIVLTAFMFYVIYGHMTDSKPPRAAAAISTFSATFLWVISAKLFAVYLSDYSVIGSIYGPYAFLVVFLLWVYYSSILFVLGGIIGQVHWERLKSAEEHAVD
jgi:membrane protein